MDRDGGVAQVVQHLPGKRKALSSNPDIEKKEKKIKWMKQSDI
jgi:hypothetical protein